MDDSQLAAGGESRQGDFLDRTALPGSGKARVMHHSSAANIDAVVGIPPARGRQVGADERVLLPRRRGMRFGTRRARIVETAVIHLGISWSLRDRSIATSV